jgi:MscS family membrane protein
MQSVENSWYLFVDVWKNGYMGVDFGTILIILLILAVSILIRGIFTKFVMNRLIAIAERTHNKLDDKVIGSMDGPIRFIPIVVGCVFAFEVADAHFGPDLNALTDNVVRSLVVFNLFWALYCAISPMTFLLGRLEEIFSKEMVNFLVKTMKAVVIGLGAATILDVWGIKVGPIIAGLGIVGVAVALGAQDLFKNLISGFLILAEKRFKAGDWVKVDDIVEGTVEKIGFRSTMVRRFDRAPTIVPNTVFADKAVTNFSEMTHRRIYWKIGVEYSTSVAQMQVITEKIKDYLIGNADFAQPDEATMFVVTDSFNASSIDIMIYCFTKTTNWGEWLEIKQDFAYALKGIVESAGTSFAFPSISVYKGVGADEPEAFEPPPDFKQGHKADFESSLFDKDGQ